MLVDLDHFPKFRGENKTYLKPPPRYWLSFHFFLAPWLPNSPPPYRKQQDAKAFEFDGSIIVNQVFEAGPHKGHTVDGSEIPRPTTWDVAKTL